MLGLQWFFFFPLSSSAGQLAAYRRFYFRDHLYTGDTINIHDIQPSVLSSWPPCMRPHWRLASCSLHDTGTARRWTRGLAVSTRGSNWFKLYHANYLG